jgi:hypothetical protein
LDQGVTGSTAISFTANMVPSNSSIVRWTLSAGVWTNESGNFANSNTQNSSWRNESNRNSILSVWLDANRDGAWNSGERRLRVKLVVSPVDLDVDSNNDGNITDADDPIETQQPGKLVRLNGNRAALELRALNFPSATGTMTLDVVPGGTGSVTVWTIAAAGAQVVLPQNYAPGDLPKTLYVEGANTGSVSLSLSSLLSGH